MGSRAGLDILRRSLLCLNGINESFLDLKSTLYFFFLNLLMSFFSKIHLMTGIHERLKVTVLNFKGMEHFGAQKYKSTKN